MRRFFLFFLLLLVLMPKFHAVAKDSCSVTLKIKDCVVFGFNDERNYFIENSSNRLMMPMSLAMEALKFKYVAYDTGSKERIFRFLNYEIRLTFGSNVAFVNDKKVLLDVAPICKPGVYEMMFFPIRLLIDHCQLEVNWNDACKELIITDNRIPSPNEFGWISLNNEVVIYESNKDLSPTFKVISYKLPKFRKDSVINISLQNITEDDINNFEIRCNIGSGSHYRIYKVDHLDSGGIFNIEYDTEIDALINNFFSVTVDY